MADSTVIKRCNNCAQNRTEHDFQDTQYGKYNRVHNVNTKGGATCTVCRNGLKAKK